MIIHILKDGRKVPDIKGHVIKASEHKMLYEVINRINERGDLKKDEAIRTSEARP